MSEENRTILVGSGMMQFEIEGHGPLSIDPIACLRECNAIEKRCEGKSDFEHLDEFKKWIKDQGGPDLSLGQANEMWRAVYLEFSRARRDFFSTLDSLRPTPV